MKEVIIKRVKSFLWRLLGMVIATVLAFIASNLDMFNMSPGMIGVVGLVIGELTKFANNYFS